jgi:protein involved in polysaccharide export with SLBB domain
MKKSIPIELTPKEEMKMQGKLTIGISIIVVSALLSCASHPTPPAGGSNPSANIQGKAQRQGFPEYRLQPGDEIEIKFFYNPSLNERLIIRPDGKISLQLIDELFVAMPRRLKSPS